MITITEKIAEHTKDIAEIKGKVGAIRYALKERLSAVETEIGKGKIKA